MSQLRLVVSQNSNRRSAISPLDSVKCTMLPASSCESPSKRVEQKLARLHRASPAAADVIERLVDDLLADY